MEEYVSKLTAKSSFVEGEAACIDEMFPDLVNEDKDRNALEQSLLEQLNEEIQASNEMPYHQGRVSCLKFAIETLRNSEYTYPICKSLLRRYGYKTGGYKKAYDYALQNKGDLAAIESELAETLTNRLVISSSTNMTPNAPPWMHLEGYIEALEEIRDMIANP